MDDTGFKKIEIKDTQPSNSKMDAVPSHSPMNSKSFKNRFKFVKNKRFLTGFGVFLFFALVIGIFLGIKVRRIYVDAQSSYKQAKAAYSSAKGQNVLTLKEELNKTKTSLENLDDDLSTISFVRFVPLAGSYYGDAVHLVRASSYGVDSAIVATESLIPYADVLGLKGGHSFVMGSAQDRIKLAVKTMGKVVPAIDKIEVELKKAKTEVDQVDPNRYPNFWVFKRIRNQIQNIKDATDQGVLAVDQGKPLIKVLPELLGESKEKKYLVIFQNDKELRPTGGFITFYSIFRVDQGIVSADSSSDIYTLDASIRSHPKADPIILKYLPKVYTSNIRDSNLSPDFKSSMKNFEALYADSNGEKKYDGIIAIDTQVLVNILKILGPVEAGGVTFKSDIDPRCNCPQVVYELESYVDKPVQGVRENRKGILGELLYAIMQKSLSSSPKLYWGRLFQSGIKDIQEKHILFYLKDSEAQKGIEALNWGGRVLPFDGDYIHINDANFAGAKANMFVTQAVKMDYNVSSNGEITKTVTITYRNPQPHSDCNLERGGLCLNATLRDFQRVYVPQGSSLTTSKGSEVKVETKKELGKTMFESFFTVNPLGKSEITYTYKLPFKLKSGSPLPVYIQKQPGTEKSSYEIYVNGKLKETFELRSDKELKLSL